MRYMYLNSRATLALLTTFGCTTGLLASDYALHLDGVSGEATSNANFDVEQLTVEAWVNVETVNLDPCCTFAGLLTWGSNSKASWEFGVVGEPAGGPLDHVYPFFKINWGQPAANTMLSGHATFDLHEWNHIAATYDGATARMYLNGELVDEAEWNVAIAPGDADAYMSIGNNFPGGDEFYGGTIDEVRIWSTARSSQQIVNTMFRPLLGTESGLLAYYDLNEGQGDTLHDNSGNAKHATLVTTPLASGAQWVVSTSPVDLNIGDINGDGAVNVIDMLLLLSEWGVCSDCPADLNGDGVVDTTDLLILLGNWG